jgi:hypothetical protein
MIPGFTVQSMSRQSRAAHRPAEAAPSFKRVNLECYSGVARQPSLFDPTKVPRVELAPLPISDDPQVMFRATRPPLHGKASK